MNPVSTGCGDNVEDGKGNSDGPTPNPTGGWFWISDPATNNKKMRTSQSTSSLQLFTIKSTEPSISRPDKGAAENTRDDVSDDHQEELVNDDERNVALRRSVSLIDITALDKDRMRDESELIKVTPMEEEGVERGNIESTFKGFGDVGVHMDIKARSVYSIGSDDHDDRDGPPEQDDALRKSAEVGRGGENKNEQNGRKQDGHVFKKLHQLEENLTKSQATMRMLHKANMGYQDEITNLKKTLEDESETKRALHEGLEASRKLCCELYEDLLQERTKCRGREISEVELHLSPKVLNFSLSDASVQTDVERIDFSNGKADQNLPYSFKDKENVSCTGSLLPTQGSISYPQATEIPRYGFYLSHLLEEYKENQKNLEVQLKHLSAQCREKDEDLKRVKDKMGGHIRLNTLLQSEKVCLEETVEQLREEVKSCDHLIQSCDSVLREKDREIRRLQEAKYELERRVAEFEFKEKELQGMVCGFQDDIGDLVSERKKLCKCVKKASKHQSPRQQVKVPEPTKKASDEREVELQAKAELLNAIREIAFKFSTSPSKSTNPQLKGDKADRGISLKGQPKKQTTGDDDKESYTARSVKKPILVTRENSLIVEKTSECSISQESVTTYDTLDSELEDESLPSSREEKGEFQRHESFRHERSTCTDLNSDSHFPTGKARELERRKKLEKTVYMYMVSKDVKTKNMKKGSMRNLDGQEVKASGVFHRSSHHGNLTVLDGLKDDEEKEKVEVTLSCHNLYSDVMNELSCKNAAAAMTIATAATKDAPPAPCTGTNGKDCISLEDASSNDSDDQLKPTDVRASLDSLPTTLDSSSDDFLDTVTKSGANLQPAANKTTGSRKVIASVEEKDYGDTSDDDDYDLKFYKKQDHLSSNNSNESDYVKGSNAQTVEPRKFPDSFATVKGTKRDQLDETTDPELGSETTDDLLSWESPQQVEEMRKGDVSRSHGISPNHCGDELQEDDLEFCVTDEEYDVREQGGKWQDQEEESNTSFDYHENPTVPWNERELDLSDLYMHQKNGKQDTGGLQIRNKIFQSGQHPKMSTDQRQSPNPVKIKKDVTNRYMKHSSLDPVDSGRQTRHHIASGRKDMDSGVIKSQVKTLEDSSGPFSVRHSPHGRYSFPEDSDDLHLGDIHNLNKTSSEESESSCDSSREASPAEGLILRKKVMENYATRAIDRAWHYVYMKQDGPRLVFYKDRMGKELGAHIEEPLVLTNAIVSVAKDYFIRKHAFRVQLPNGHQYLFAAKDDREMMYWVCRLDAAGAPPTHHHGDAYSCNPAAITTIPPPTSGSPTRSERFKNLIKGGISALLK